MMKEVAGRKVGLLRVALCWFSCGRRFREHVHVTVQSTVVHRSFLPTGPGVSRIYKLLLCMYICVPISIVA